VTEPSHVKEAVALIGANGLSGDARSEGKEMMSPALLRPILGGLLAIAIPAAMDAAGMANFSALALFPLMLLFWVWDRHSLTNLGFAWGTPRSYYLAVLWPLLVVGALVLIAFAAGAVDLTHTLWGKSLRSLALLVVVSILLAIVTEEGFFRGWLWASLGRAGLAPTSVLFLTSIAFALGHVSTAVLDTVFSPAPAQIPIYLLVAVVAGVTLGLLRSISGSVIVSSVGHGIWNGVVYVLFGAGTKLGALGVVNTALFGPETGILGLAANSIFAFGLWLLWRRARQSSHASRTDLSTAR
jgi:membrane protease YdiL (CAAX protease family)